MARVTDTREQVRKVADQLMASGKTPTPTVVRLMLGKGGMGTIVSELKAWEASRELRATGRPLKPADPAVQTSQALDRIGASEAAELVRGAAEVAETLKETVDEIREVAGSLTSLPSKFERLVVLVEGLAGMIKADRGWMQAELNKAYERYDAVQKYSMRQIEEAREETRVAKEQLRAVSKDAGFSKEMVYKRQTDELRNLVVRLQGRLDERGIASDDVVLPPRIE